MGLLTVLAFAVLVGRFWDPYYGFTRFLQFSSAAAEVAIPEMRERTVYVYSRHGGYDGMYYAQLAFHPLLNSPDLVRALDNPGYRARRILTSALAWVLAGGSDSQIAHAFAWMNVLVWFALAALLWRLLEVRDGWTWLAWAGLLFSAGALNSVRRSLVDLPALLLIAAGMHLFERGHLRRGVGLLAAAALTRETALLAVAAPAPARLGQRGGLRHLLIVGTAVCLPLAVWLFYVAQRLVTYETGAANFSWPLHGWLASWPETLAELRQKPEFRWLITSTLLATVGITVQGAFFIVYRRIGDAWWRLGAIHLLLGAVLGHVFWNDHPGGINRVLLPLSLAFVVCAIRWQVLRVWIIAGSLTVFSGLEGMRSVDHHPEQLDVGRTAGGSYVPQLVAGFFPREELRGGARAWSSGDATLELLLSRPAAATPVHVVLEARGFTQRSLRIADAHGARWAGHLGQEWQTIDVLVRPGDDGRWLLHLTSAEPPAREGDFPGARLLAFCIRSVRVSAPP